MHVCVCACKCVLCVCVDVCVYLVYLAKVYYNCFYYYYGHSLVQTLIGTTYNHLFVLNIWSIDFRSCWGFMLNGYKWLWWPGDAVQHNYYIYFTLHMYEQKISERGRMLIIVLYNDMRSNYDIKHIMICLPYNYPKIIIYIHLYFLQKKVLSSIR